MVNKDKTKRKPGVQNQPNAPLISLTARSGSATGTCGGTSPSPRQEQHAAGWGDLDSVPSRFERALLAGWGGCMEWDCFIFLDVVLRLLVCHALPQLSWQEREGKARELLPERH